MFTKDDTDNYKRWAIKQRIQELMKAMKRNPTSERQIELENLKKDLDD